MGSAARDDKLCRSFAEQLGMVVGAVEYRGLYAARLGATGVDCSLERVDGAYHRFDAVQPSAPLSESFHASRRRALASALPTGAGR